MKEHRNKIKVICYFNNDGKNVNEIIEKSFEVFVKKELEKKSA